MISVVSAGSRLAVGSSARITAGCLGERARDGHALLLAARQRVGAPGGQVGEPDLGQALEGQGAVARRKAAEQARQRRDVAQPAGEHVVEHRGASHQVELLEDHADLPAR